MLFGDAFSRILDVEQQVPGLPAVAQRDGALLGEFHRIVDKIGDDLQQPVLVPDDAALLLMVAEKQFDEKNIMLARRKGTNREGIILAEYAGKGGVCHLDKADGRMTDILSGRDYQGDVFLKPYEVLVLEKSC